jgi:predicted dehydrogenase
MAKSTRREFMGKVMGLSVAGMTAGCVHTTPVTKAAGHKAVGANDRIQCGFVGIGSRGGSILQSALQIDSVQMVAVADTYDANRDQAAALCKKKFANTASYVRFEEMLEKEKLDAIITATPDHIHAPVIFAALDRGLDVYTEKPMTLTSDLAKAIRDRVKAKGAVLQVGTQLRSMTMYQKVREVVQSGKLGKLVQVQVNRDGGGTRLDRSLAPATANEQNTHWPLFLRDTKPYAYDPLRYFFWRQFCEYSNGYFGDLMLHHLDICHFVTGCGMPKSVKAAGGIFLYDDGRTCPDTVDALIEYPEGFVFNYVTTTGNGHYGLVERYLFSKGTIEVRNMSEASIFGSDGTEEKVASKGILNGPHLDNFFECIRSRKKTIAPVEAGLMAASCAHMAMRSMNEGKAAQWDAASESVRMV